MFQKVTKKLFGSRNQRLVNRYSKTVKKINDLEDQYKALDDEALKNKTVEFRSFIANGGSLEEISTGRFCDCTRSSESSIRDAPF